MSVKHEWSEDSEAMSIAMEVVTKFVEMFNGIDLSKIRFLRIKEKKTGKACKVTSVGFPVNIDVPYLYYMEINDEKWKAMTDAQRNLTVFSGLYEISPGGMDPESINYGKKRKREVEDFDTVLAAAGGRYDWNRIGVQAIPNILEEKTAIDEKTIDTEA